MAKQYLRCDECNHLYFGEADDQVEIHDIDVTALGDKKRRVAARSALLCGECRSEAEVR